MRLYDDDGDDDNKIKKQHKAADTYTLYIRFLILSVAVLYIFETKRNCFCYNICYIPNVNLTIIAGDDYIVSTVFDSFSPLVLSWLIHDNDEMMTRNLCAWFCVYMCICFVDRRFSLTLSL